MRSEAFGHFWKFSGFGIFSDDLSNFWMDKYGMDYQSWRIPGVSKSDWDKYDAKKPNVISFVALDPYASLLNRCKFHRDEMKTFSKTQAFKSTGQWSNDIKVESYNLFGAYPNKNWARLDEEHYGYGYDPVNEKKRTDEEETEMKIIHAFKEKIKELDSTRGTSTSDDNVDGIIISRKFTSNMDEKKPYRYFRIKQQGRNGYSSSRSNYLYMGYWELYGRLLNHIHLTHDI